MKILYFAWIREKMGKESETIQLPDNISNVAELINHLSKSDDVFKIALEKPENVKVAVNQSLVNWDHPISNDDEIAFFPPMTGG